VSRQIFTKKKGKSSLGPGVRHPFFPNTLEQENALTLTEREQQHEQLFRQYHDKASEEYSVKPWGRLDRKVPKASDRIALTEKAALECRLLHFRPRINYTFDPQNAQLRSNKNPCESACNSGRTTKGADRLAKISGPPPVFSSFT